jgi:hypothetical protein
MTGVASIRNVRYDTLVLTNQDYDSRGLLDAAGGASRAQIWSERARNAGVASGAGAGTVGAGETGQRAPVSRWGSGRSGDRERLHGPVNREAEIGAAIESAEDSFSLATPDREELTIDYRP